LISWGVAPGCINIAPLGLEDIDFQIIIYSPLGEFRFQTIALAVGCFELITEN
jgi:hypothetical protein